MSAFRYGASFVDQATGLRFEAHHPASRPDRWSAYLDGAAREYARYGIGELLDRQSLERGEGVPLFFVGVDGNDRVVTGLRCHGPLEDADASQALVEMALSPEVGAHRAAVEEASRYGVVEIKGAWRAMSGDGNHDVIAALARCCVHCVRWAGAELMLAAVADRMEPVLAAIGGLMMGTEGSPFPTERYRTILVGLRRARYAPLLSVDQAKILRQDAEQLAQPPAPGATTGWRPVVLDVRRRDDRQVLANLRADPGIEMIDVAQRQRDELAKLLPPPHPALLGEPDMHVYYPWRRCVVRMLGPRAFGVVRLDRNRNRITTEEQARLRRQRVGVVGLSAGHAIAATLALEGTCGELRLADFDEVELTNLNRLPATVLDVGVNKAVVAARRVAELDPYLPVQISRQGLRDDNVDEFVAGLDVVIDECDDIAMKLRLREVARRQQVAVLMETSDRGLLDVERFDVEPERPLLHGLLDGVTSSAMATMTVMEKIPHVLRVVDARRASARGAASLAEVGRTLSTWPQLGADVTLGGATVAAAVRRLGLGGDLPSGRVRVDLEALVGSLENPLVGAGDDSDERVDHSARPSSPPADPLLSIAHAASLAPSGGNAQPWRFELSDDEISFEVDRSRHVTMDVRSRGSYVALGAALFNARVAAAASNLLGDVAVFPHGPTSDVVATLGLRPGTDESLAALYPSMLARCTNRRAGAPTPIDISLAASLADAVAQEGCRLHLVTDREHLSACAQVLGASERIRFLTPTLHREMMHELRFPGEDASTGIDVRTLELSRSQLATLDVVRRADVMELLERWDAGDALGDSARSAVLSSSALAIVAAPSSSPHSYVHGGCAVERLWILASAAGMGVQPVSPVFVFAVQQADFDTLGGDRWGGELRVLSERFREFVGLDAGAATALVLRLSHATPPTARSIRLPLETVLRRRATPSPGHA